MMRIYRRRPPYWALVAIFVAGLALIAPTRRWLHVQSDGHSPRDAPLAEGEYSVARVVDGNTLVVVVPSSTTSLEAAPRHVQVRLLGVDVPEGAATDQLVEQIGEAAAAFLRERLSDKHVRLQFGRRRIDEFDRVLAYVFVDELLVNEELVRAGLARLATLPGDEGTLQTRIRKAQDEARAAKRGVWRLDPSPAETGAQ